MMTASTLAVLVGSFIPCVLLFIWWKLRQFSSMDNLPPGPPRKLLFGEMFHLKPRLFLYFHNIWKQYGEIAYFEMAMKRVMVLSSLRATREAYSRAELSGRIRTKLLDDFTHCSGIVMMDGPVWKEHRRLSLKILRDFGVGKTLLEEAIQKEALELVEHIDAIRQKQQQGIDTNALFSITTTNIICSLVFGVRPGYNEESEYYKLSEALKVSTQDTNIISQFIISLPGFEKVVLLLNMIPSLQKIKKSVEYTHEFIIQHIAEHRQAFHAEDEPSDFIYAYLQEQSKNCASGGVNFDDWKIIRVVLELFIAGTDTTSTQITWMTLLMALHPEIWQKTTDEIRKICGTEKIVSMEDKKKLNYTQAVLDEVMRFSVITPTGGLPHRALEDCTLLGYHVPKNTLLFLNFYSICRDPAVWKHPDTFNPENFLNDEGLYAPNDHLIPFSIGKRACLGESLARMELFIFIVTLLQRYRFEVDENVDLKEVMVGTDGAIRAPGKHTIKFIPIQ